MRSKKHVTRAMDALKNRTGNPWPWFTAVRVVFDHSKNQRKASFSGPVTLVTFGSEQYVWENDAENSHADPDGPPVSTVVPETRDRTFVLPKASITVLRGEVERLMR